MSSVKDYLFEFEQNAFLEWAGNRQDRNDLDEESEAYQTLAQEYSDMMDAYEQEAEYRWLERKSFHEQYLEFSSELGCTRMLLRQSEHGARVQMTCKLVYAHAVTLGDHDQYLGSGPCPAGQVFHAQHRQTDRDDSAG